MNARPTIPVIAAILLAAVRADTVTLDNGKTLEGRVTDNGATVTVELAHGTVRLHKSRIKSIAAKATPQDEAAARAAAIEAALAAGEVDRAQAADSFHALAQWAGKNRLSHARTQALEKALELIPGHEAAREDSGYVLHEGRWISRAERNQKMGFVRLEGQWIPREAAADAKRAREDSERREPETGARTEQAAPAPVTPNDYDAGRVNRYLRTRAPMYGPYLSVSRVTLGDPPFIWPVTPICPWSYIPAPNLLVTNRPPAKQPSNTAPAPALKPVTTPTPRPDPTRPPFLPAQ